jgi:hypothetical protein
MLTISLGINADISCGVLENGGLSVSSMVGRGEISTVVIIIRLDSTYGTHIGFAWGGNSVSAEYLEVG